jgi:DmsE family decaheme c-type cytochrome
MRAVLAFACMAILGSTDSVRAEPRISLNDISAAVRSTTPAPRQSADNGYSALLDFVQLIGAETPKTVSATAPVDANHQFSDPAYATLWDFAQRLGTAQPQSTKALPKLAEADNIFDSLVEGMKGSGQPAPAAETPKTSKTSKAKHTSAPVDATFVGAKTCLTCHASQTAAFEKTLMGKIGKTQKGKFDCENCHGPGSAHVKAGGGRGVGGMISFRPEDQSRTAEENNALCLGCHEKGNRTNWHGSTHDERGLMCTNCHTVMKNVSRKSQLKTEFQPDTCFQCHKNKRAEMFRSSHIPVREGKVVCTDCHNPHGSYSESLLKTATVNEACYQCHAEKRGPFLWEHPPVSENCLNCHDPHGSNNDFLLKISRPRLCQQCHSGGQHNSNPRNPAVTLYAQGRECQNCHSNHHGSNNPAGARFMR